QRVPGAGALGRGVVVVGLVFHECSFDAIQGVLHKSTYPHRIYQDYGMVPLPRCQSLASRLNSTHETEQLRMTRIRRLSGALAVAGVLGVAVPAAASAVPTITISGATASYPLVLLLAQKYVKLHPHTVKFKITQGGAQIGVNDVAAGRVT